MRTIDIKARRDGWMFHDIGRPYSAPAVFATKQQCDHALHNAGNWPYRECRLVERGEEIGRHSGYWGFCPNVSAKLVVAAAHGATLFATGVAGLSRNSPLQRAYAAKRLREIRQSSVGFEILASKVRERKLKIIYDN